MRPPNPGRHQVPISREEGSTEDRERKEEVRRKRREGSWRGEEEKTRESSAEGKWSGWGRREGRL